MADVTTLGIGVDTSGVTRARDELGRFTKASEQAEAAASKFEGSARGSAAGADTAAAGVARARDEFGRFVKGADQGAEAARRFHAEAGKQSALSGLTSGVGLLAGRLYALYAAAQAVKEIAKMADEITNLSARLRLVSMSAGEAAAAQQILFNIAQRTNTSFAETAGAYTKLVEITRLLGVGAAGTAQLVEGINNAFRVSGASSQEASAALRQFGQAMASGVLRGDEFNSMAENSPRLMKAMADGLGVPRAALRDMAAEGKLTAEVVLPALQAGLEKVNKEAAELPPTFGGAVTNLKNGVTALAGAWVNGTGAAAFWTTAINGAGEAAAGLGRILDKNIPKVKMFALDMFAEGQRWFGDQTGAGQRARLKAYGEAQKQAAAAAQKAIDEQEQAEDLKRGTMQKKMSEFRKAYGTEAERIAIEIEAWRDKMGTAFTPEMEKAIRDKMHKKGPKAQLMPLDLSGVKAEVDEAKSLYQDAEFALDSYRKAGVISEQQYRDSISASRDQLIANLTTAYEEERRLLDVSLQEAKKKGRGDEELARIQLRINDSHRQQAKAIAQVQSEASKDGLKSWVDQQMVLKRLTDEGATIGLDPLQVELYRISIAGLTPQLEAAAIAQARLNDERRKVASAEESLKAMRDEAAVYGMTATEIELYKLAKMGANSVQLAEARELQDLKAVRALIDENRTAAERYAGTMKELERLRQKGLGDAAYQRAGKKAWEQYAQSVDRAELSMESLQGLTLTAALEIQDQLGTITSAFVQGKFSDIGKAFESMINNMLSRMMAAALQQAVMAPLLNAIGMPGVSAGTLGLPGGARAGGGTVSGRGMYEVGERGPEMATIGGRHFLLPGQDGSITPTSRMGGSTTVQVNVVNNGAPVAVASQRQRQTSTGPVVDIVLREVARDIARGGPVADALQGQYGLNRAQGVRV